MNVYGVTRRFPSEERFGRRAPKDKAHFYTIAAGSAEELKYFLILARDLGYQQDVQSLYSAVEEVSRMLHRLTEATLERAS